jgi:hypothetical protein
MRVRVAFILLLMFPALILPGGVAGVHCLSACCADMCADEGSCCESEDQTGVQVSEIPACCLESAAWMTPDFVRGGIPEARFDVDFGTTRPLVTTDVHANSAARLVSFAPIEPPPRPPDSGRVVQLLI